jgi:hypothetical protein
MASTHIRKLDRYGRVHKRVEGAPNAGGAAFMLRRYALRLLRLELLLLLQMEMATAMVPTSRSLELFKNNKVLSTHT